MKKSETKLIQCPVCKGEGKIKAPAANKTMTDLKRAAARALVANGFSYREVSVLIGYKSQSSVQQAVESKN